MSYSSQGVSKDEDEEELYGDISKLNKHKGGKRKLIDAAHPKNLNLDNLEDTDKMNNDFKASGGQEEKGTGRDEDTPPQKQ